MKSSNSLGIICAGSRSLKVVSARDGALLKDIGATLPTSSIQEFVYIPDKNALLVCDGKSPQIDVVFQGKREHIALETNAGVTSIMVNPENSLLAFGCGNGDFGVRDFSSEGKCTMFKAGSSLKSINSVSLNATSKYLVCSSVASSSIYVAGLEKGTVPLTLRVDSADLPCHYVRKIQCSPHEKACFASGHENGEFRLWDLRQRKPVHTLSLHRAALTDFLFWPVTSSNLILSVGKDGFMAMLDTRTMSIIKRVQFGGCPLTCLSAVASESLVGVGSEDGRVFVIRNMQQPSKFETLQLLNQESISRIAFCDAIPFTNVDFKNALPATATHDVQMDFDVVAQGPPRVRDASATVTAKRNGHNGHGFASDEEFVDADKWDFDNGQLTPQFDEGVFKYGSSSSMRKSSLEKFSQFSDDQRCVEPSSPLAPKCFVTTRSRRDADTVAEPAHSLATIPEGLQSAGAQQPQASALISIENRQNRSFPVQVSVPPDNDETENSSANRALISDIVHKLADMSGKLDDDFTERSPYFQETPSVKPRTVFTPFTGGLSDSLTRKTVQFHQQQEEDRADNDANFASGAKDQSPEAFGAFQTPDDGKFNGPTPMSSAEAYFTAPTKPIRSILRNGNHRDAVNQASPTADAMPNGFDFPPVETGTNAGGRENGVEKLVQMDTKSLNDLIDQRIEAALRPIVYRLEDIEDECARKARVVWFQGVRERLELEDKLMKALDEKSDELTRVLKENEELRHLVKQLRGFPYAQYNEPSKLV